MSPWHWALVIAVGVLLFGAKRLPDAARSLGRSARILKAELRDEPAPAPGPVAADPGTSPGTTPDTGKASTTDATATPPRATAPPTSG